MSEEKKPAEGVLDETPQEITEVLGEEGVEFEIGEVKDPYAITTEEHDPIYAQIAPYTDDGEPQRVEEIEDPIKLVVARDKKFYQRGIIQIIKDGVAPINLSVDLLTSILFKAYDVRNPYRLYNPMIPRAEATAVVKIGFEQGEDLLLMETKEIQEIFINESSLEHFKEKYQIVSEEESLAYFKVLEDINKRVKLQRIEREREALEAKERGEEEKVLEPIESLPILKEEHPEYPVEYFAFEKVIVSIDEHPNPETNHQENVAPVVMETATEEENTL